MRGVVEALLDDDTHISECLKTPRMAGADPLSSLSTDASTSSWPIGEETERSSRRTPYQCWSALETRSGYSGGDQNP